MERLEALRIPRRRLEAAMVADGRLAVRLVAMLSKRVGDLERRMEAFLTRPVESRVADFLVEASRRHGIPDSRGVLIGVKFTHQEIASYVGSTRETVTLVLGDLKRRGLIGTDHRRVIVHESEALERLV
jgi:CRP-like cAMP-binding protein